MCLIFPQHYEKMKKKKKGNENDINLTDVMEPQLEDSRVNNPNDRYLPLTLAQTVW